MRSVLCVFLAAPALAFGVVSAAAQQAPTETSQAAEAKPARKSWVPAFLRNYENPAPRAVLPGTQETAAAPKEPAAEQPSAKAAPVAEAPKKTVKKKAKKKAKKKKVAKKKSKAVKKKAPEPAPEPENVAEGAHEVATFEVEEPVRTQETEIRGGRGSVSMPPVIEPPLTGTPIDTLALYKQAMSSGDITGALALFRQTVNTPPDINLVAKLNTLMEVSLSSDQASELVEEVAEFAAVQPPRPASVEAARIHGVHDMIADAAAPSLVVALEHYKSAVAAGDQLAAVQSLTRVLGRPVDDEAARQANMLLNLPSASLWMTDQAAVQAN